MPEVVDFFSKHSNLDLIKEKSNLLNNLERSYLIGSVGTYEVRKEVDKANKEVFNHSDVIVRGIAPKLAFEKDKDLIDAVIKENGDKIAIRGGREKFQSWTSNPAYGFYYSIGGGNGFVIALDKDKLENYRVMEYQDILRGNRIMESGEYNFKVPWNFWREFEVRTPRDIERFLKVQ